MIGLFGVLGLAAFQQAGPGSTPAPPAETTAGASTQQLQVPPPPAVLGGGAPAFRLAGNEEKRFGGFVVHNGQISERRGTTTGFFLIVNQGHGADRLLGLSSPLADSVELLRLESGREVVQPTMEYLPVTELSTGDDAEARRLREHNFEVRFRLSGFRQPEDPSDGVPITFHFEKAGDFTVRAFTYVPASAP